MVEASLASQLASSQSVPSSSLTAHRGDGKTCTGHPWRDFQVVGTNPSFSSLNGFQDSRSQRQQPSWTNNDEAPRYRSSSHSTAQSAMFRPVGGPIKPPREGNERQANELAIEPDCKCTPAGAMTGKGMPLMIGWSFA